MRIRFVSSSMLAFLLVASCSSSSASDSNGVSAPCGDVDTWLVDGNLGAKAIHETGAAKSFFFENFSTGNLNASWDGGTTHVTWGKTLASGEVGDVTSATLDLTSTPGALAFRSGKLSYDSQSTESTLRTSLIFDQGTVTLCSRRARP